MVKVDGMAIDRDNTDQRYLIVIMNLSTFWVKGRNQKVTLYYEGKSAM